MASRAAQYERLSGRTVRVTWTGLLNGDVGDPVSLPSNADKSVHFFGNFGGGGAISLRGRNSTSANWQVVNNSDHLPITKTSEGGAQIMENMLQNSPEVIAGDGATNLTCVIICTGK